MKEMSRTTIAVLVLLCLVLTACGCNKVVKPDGSDELTTVNGQAIARSDYIAALHDSRVGNTEALPQDPVTWLQLKVTFLDQLIESQLLVQEAARHSIVVLDEDVQEALNKIKADWPADKFAGELKNRQMSEESLRKGLRNKLLTDTLVEKVVAPAIEVREDEVQAYYRSNPDEFARPEQVRARQILVRSEAEAAEILTRILTGGSFMQMAIDHSIAPEAREGGDLGYFSKGQMPKVVEQACFALDVMQTSDIIKSPYGYHIFRVEDKRPATVISLNTARPEITRKLRDEKLDTAWREFIGNLKESADIQINETMLTGIRQDEI